MFKTVKPLPLFQHDGIKNLQVRAAEITAIENDPSGNPMFKILVVTVFTTDHHINVTNGWLKSHMVNVGDFYIIDDDEKYTMSRNEFLISHTKVG